MKNLRPTIYGLAKRALGHLLPPVKSAHSRLGRWIRQLERAREALPPSESAKRWINLVPPVLLPPEGARRLSPDPGEVFVVSKMRDDLDALLALHLVRSPFTLSNWQGYRQAMERVGVDLPESEPLRELSPVGLTPLDCHFDFEMPEFFIKNPPCPDVDRTPFEIELHSDDVRIGPSAGK